MSEMGMITYAKYSFTSKMLKARNAAINKNKENITFNSGFILDKETFSFLANSLTKGSSLKLSLMILKTEILASAKLTPTILSQILKNQKASTSGSAIQLRMIKTRENISAFLLPVLLMRLTQNRETTAIGISLKDSKKPRPL